jgi:hypothetical protein
VDLVVVEGDGVAASFTDGFLLLWSENYFGCKIGLSFRIYIEPWECSKRRTIGVSDAFIYVVFIHSFIHQ